MKKNVLKNNIIFVLIFILFLCNACSVHQIQNILNIVPQQVQKPNQNRTNDLISAIETDNIDKALYAIEHGADLNFKKDDKTPLFLYAVVMGNTSIVKAMYDAGADIDAPGFIWLDKNTFYGSPLSAAVAGYGKKYFEIMQFLIEECDVYINKPEYNPLTKKHNGWPAIIYAVAFSQKEKLVYLLKHGATINTNDFENGKTLMHYAAQLQNADILSLLLSRGVKIDSRDQLGKTPLFYANFLTISYLLNNGADSTIADNTGLTAYESVRNRYAITDAHWAVITQKLDALKEFSKVELNKFDKAGLKPLNYAMALANKEACDYLFPLTSFSNANSLAAKNLSYAALLFNDAYLEKTLRYVGIPDDLLARAVSRNNKDAVLLLLKRGSDVNSRDKLGILPLSHAVVADDIEMVSLLLQHGAKINVVQDKNGKTPIIYAAGLKTIDILTLLHKSGGNLDQANTAGDTALHFAVRSNTVDTTLYLLENNVNPDYYNRSFITAMHIAAQKNNVQVLDILAQYGARLNQTDNNGKTPFIYALENVSISSVRHLLFQNINIYEYKESSPLHIVIKQDLYELFNDLINSGVFLDLPDLINQTPLMYAVLYGKNRYVQDLIAAGANCKLLDNNNESALHFAVKVDNIEAVKLLLQNGVDIELEDNKKRKPLLTALSFSSTESAKLLIKAGANINKLENNRSALAYAVLKNNVEIVKYLFKTRTISGTHFVNDKGYTVLHCAASNNFIDIAKVLIENEIDLNTQTVTEHTALHFSLANQYWEISKMLIEGGADVNVQTSEGYTAIMFAVELGNLEISKMLLKKGADINLAAKNGTTPLAIAKQNKNTTLITMLKKFAAQE